MEQQPNPQWRYDEKQANAPKFADFAGKHPREYKALFRNLDKIMQLLRDGSKIGGFRVNFFQSEGEGVYRIGQTGVPHAKESRLYVYPDSDKRIMYIINIGIKDGQTADINEAHRIARTIKATITT